MTSLSFFSSCPTGQPQRKIGVVLPIVLHLCILAFYIALWIIRARHAEQYEIAPEWADSFQNILNNLPHVRMLVRVLSGVADDLLQYIMLALTTALVYVMQPVAILSVYSRLPQPLTTLSDKMAAWQGLGASLAVLYDNLGYRVALTEVLVITLYFAAITGLGTSSSYTFKIPIAEFPTRQLNTTWLGVVPLDALLPSSMSNDPPSNFSGLRFDWYLTSLALESDFYVNAEELAGVDPFRNRVFDTLSQPLPSELTGHARVNFTEFHVKCGSVPQVSLSATALQSSASGASGLPDDGIPTLLSINYTLGSQSMNLSDSMFISVSNASNAVSELWQPSS